MFFKIINYQRYIPQSNIKKNTPIDKNNALKNDNINS